MTPAEKAKLLQKINADTNKAQKSGKYSNTKLDEPVPYGLQNASKPKTKRKK